MKTLLLVLVFVVVAVCAKADATLAAVNAYNYSLRDVMVPNRTYTGVLVNAEEVVVRVGPRGLVPGLTAGLVNFGFGTNLGGRKVKVYRYVVRLDVHHPDDVAEVITVIQGGGSMVEAGTPVFLSGCHDRDGIMFAVRMITATTPAAYQVVGMEEQRRAGRQPAR